MRTGLVRSVKLTLLAVLAMLLAPAVTQSGAAAAPTGDAGALASVTCTVGRLCIYRDTNFNGHARRFTVGENDYHTVNWWNFDTDTETDDEMNDGASSVINHTDGWIRLYRDTDFEDLVICMGAHSSVHRLSLFTFDSPVLNRTMDNKVSSHSVSRTDACDFRVEPGQNR